MSVPKNKRTENKLQALKETLDMVKYTIQMCENEKIFPKKARWNLCSRIIENCLDIVAKVRQANRIDASTIPLAKMRLSLQYQVLLDFEALWGLMTIAYESYCIPSQKAGIWSSLTLAAENRVIGWRKHDMERLRQLTV